MTQRDMPDDVRRAIQEVRDRDMLSGDAPSLAAVLRRRHVRGGPRTASPARLAFAAALVVAVVLGYRSIAHSLRREAMPLPREVLALSRWRAMTDVLLETPGRDLLRDTSPLAGSIINVNTTGAFR